MNANDPNVVLLEVVAERLGDALREQMVFVGGAVAGLLITAPLFVATKLEAFDGRGNADFLFSHDLGDLLAVVDGRDTLMDECRNSPSELRLYFCERFAGLLETPSFVEALAGHLPGDAASQERLPELRVKLRMIAELDAT